MADFSDLYAPQGNYALASADSLLQGGLATTQTGLAQSRLMSNYSTRALPDLVNNYSAKGTVRGGGAGVAADRLKEDTVNQFGDLQMGLNENLANFARNRLMSMFGTMA